jgi:hypothetical protein
MICLLIPRIFTQWNDEKRLKGRMLFAVISLEIVLLLPLMTLTSVVIFAFFLVIYHILLWMLEKRCANSNLVRIYEFVFILVAGSFIFGIFDTSIRFNGVAVAMLNYLMENNALLRHHSHNMIRLTVVYLFALLVLINEINHIIRFILKLIETEPMLKTQTSESGTMENETIDSRELHRGKIIGVIERILFFFFVVTNNYASIAFILTAKGITRYKELDDKNFAEYFLIGTLLSSALSIFWAFYIHWIIGAL